MKQKRAATAHPQPSVPPFPTRSPDLGHPAITELSAVIQTQLAEMCQGAVESSGLLCLTFSHFRLTR